MRATRSEILAIFGELDPLVIADIESTGATAAQVREAREWLFSASIERRAGSPDPAVRRVVRIVRDALELEAEPELRPSAGAIAWE